MASSDNNNMEIELYQPSQVGETDVVNPTNTANRTNAANPRNSANANSANAAELSTTISDNQNADADSTTGWKWMWPKVRNPAGKKTSILFYVKTDVIQDINNRLGKQTLERFRESCFGAYLHYPRNQVPGTVMHLMLRQQVIKEGANVSHSFSSSTNDQTQLAMRYRLSIATKKPCTNNTLAILSRLSFDLLRSLNFIFEAVPGLADILTSKPKHKCVQPRLLKRLCHTKSLDLYSKFFDEQDIQCFEKLEPTKQELIDYTWWHHVADDVRSSVRYIHRESNFVGKAIKTPLKQTREQSLFQNRVKEMPRFLRWSLGRRRGLARRRAQMWTPVREVQEMASRKADDMRSDIKELRKTVEELRRHKNYASFEQDYVAFEKPPPPSPTEQTSPPLLPQNTPAPPPKKRTPPPSPTEQTPSPLLPQNTPQSKISALNIRRAIRPPRDNDGTTSYLSDRTNKHMIAYLAYLESDFKEMRHVGNDISFENASFFKRIEDPTEWMETPAIDAYLRILHLSPEFFGCHPEGKGKFVVLGSYFLKLSRKMYHGDKASKILDEDKGQMEKLDPKDEIVKLLLDHVLVSPYCIRQTAGPHLSRSPKLISDEDKRVARYDGTFFLRRILPALLQLSGFYAVRKDLKLVNREWDLRFAENEQYFLQTDSVSC
ncbi:hypothetical protein CASFOL_009194 [Castilleja foliolosa]|uniref:Uncharacterized protein n=1 Tax=Castilleja foliolosa TaxID=1961234 RepID=A0ABD3DWL3_9LAMI